MISVHIGLGLAGANFELARFCARSINPRRLVGPFVEIEVGKSMTYRRHIR
jgi:hypothetical protein